MKTDSSPLFLRPNGSIARSQGGAHKPSLGCALLYLLASTVPLPAHADDAAVEQKAQTCIACHGPYGQSTNPTTPSLAGQTSRYIYEQLRDFSAGRRQSVTMTPIAKTLSSDDMQVLGDYFGAQRPMSSSDAIDPAKVAQGQSTATGALCTMCHLDGLAGQNEIPRVAGQQYAYLVKALESFRDGKRTNDGGNMQAVMHGLSDAEIEALGQYVANLN
jgi:cytochrome c553